MEIEFPSPTQKNDFFQVEMEIINEKMSVEENLQNFFSPKLTYSTYKEFHQIHPDFLVFEYINDIWDNFMKLESELSDYSYQKIFITQSDFSFFQKMRGILIDWFISLYKNIYKQISTFFLSINILDRFLSQIKVDKKIFQLIGICCLSIGIKFEEIVVPPFGLLAEITDGAFTKKEINKKEIEIMKNIKFNVGVPCCNDFFDILCVMFKFDKNEIKLGKSLMITFMTDINCTKFKQSQIALATTFILLKLRKNTDNEENNNYDNCKSNGNDGNGWNVIEYYCDKFKVNFIIWKNKIIIESAAKYIFDSYKNKDFINNNYHNLFSLVYN